jgi:hypothetical protein
MRYSIPQEQKSDFKFSCYLFSDSNCSTKRLRIKSSSSISILFQLFPDNNQIFFYNENIVSHSKSFEELGISNGDRITSIPKTNTSFEEETFWRKISKSDPNENNYFSDFYNEQTAKVFRRMKDLSQFQTESSTKLFRNVIHNFQFVQNHEQNIIFSTNLNFGLSVKPSSNPLPTLW